MPLTVAMTRAGLADRVDADLVVRRPHGVASVDSTTSTPRNTASGPTTRTIVAGRRGAMATISPTAVMRRPHEGSSCASESSANATTPRMLPMRSNWYASRLARRWNDRATPSPRHAITVATATNTTGSTTQRGGSGRVEVEEDELLAGHAHLDVEHAHQHHQRGQGERGEAVERHLGAAGPQEAEADAEEAAEQDDVGEVGQVEHVGARASGSAPAPRRA